MSVSFRTVSSVFFCCSFVLSSACDDVPVSGPAVSVGDASDDVGTDAASSLDLIDNSADAAEKAACEGASLNPAFAAFDSQCSYLNQCANLGSCYCGDGCPATKTRCAPGVCKDDHPKCFCGKSCGASQVHCPDYICGANVPEGCETHDDCVYDSSPTPSWCGCQKMPDHCFCGEGCMPNQTKCDAKDCKNMPVKGCTASTKSFTNCYCDRCGLLGKSAKCWFIVCPGPQP